MSREATQEKIRLDWVVKESFRKFSFWFRRQDGKQEQNQFAKEFDTPGKTKENFSR
jgi:hypothetical protein